MTEETKTIKPGVYPDISNADYHGGPGISKSGLDLIRRSPMHYRAVVDAEHDRDPTQAQAVGTAFHALLLEPEVFTRDYCLALRQQDVPHAIDDRDVLVGMVHELNAKRLPRLSLTGKKDELAARIIEARREMGLECGEAIAAGLADMSAGDLKDEINKLNVDRPGLLPVSGNRHELATLLRENGVQVTLWSDVQAEWAANNGHRKVLTQETWDQLHAMRDAVMQHPMAAKLLDYSKGLAEQSVYWIDPETGVLCRCRPDWWRQDLGIVLDVKTTDDASPEEFRRSLHKWRYHVQDPFYMDCIKQATGTRPRAFLFLAVEKKPPYAVAIYQLDAESVEQGRKEYRQDLDLYAECERTGQWPGYGERIQSISLPEWYLIRQSYEKE